ncbi:hypothetical protein PAMC26577_23285 [Caballeronia sordidicola]|uniref:Uncharacterized protein n=1 Tax=Caballeronia sordidicola TaxID=196367 RepID=A0A242MKQ5_CABSO|nr:hypothetical protein PAMC26577_23285 [Caballeronia sordidicola]
MQRFCCSGSWFMAAFIAFGTHLERLTCCLALRLPLPILLVRLFAAGQVRHVQR